MTTHAVDTERSIRTFSGIWFNVFNPDINLIDIVDIAHSLAMQCRFNGHTQEFYTVAQHSVWVAERVPLEHRMAALLHDAPEAYLSDIASPIKKYFTQYHSIEDDVMKAVASRFKIQYPFHESIKIFDREALKWEWENKVIANNFVEDNWDFKTAKTNFLKYYYDLVSITS